MLVVCFISVTQAAWKSVSPGMQTSVGPAQNVARMYGMESGTDSLKTFIICFLGKMKGKDGHLDFV